MRSGLLGFAGRNVDGEAATVVALKRSLQNFHADGLFKDHIEEQLLKPTATITPGR
jgi:hypothetical protein